MNRAAQASRMADALVASIDNGKASAEAKARRERIAALGRRVCDDALADAEPGDVLSILKAVVREACARIKAMAGHITFASFWGSLGSTYVAPKGKKADLAAEAESHFTGGATE